ncbi:hypothetical protein ACLB2K_004623 [Fragaria x ananassa]
MAQFLFFSLPILSRTRFSPLYTRKSSRSPSAAVRPLQPAAPVPFAIAGEPWLKRKPSSRASIPPKGSLHLKLGLELEFVVVRNVVEEVKREMLPNFGDHRRSPAAAAEKILAWLGLELEFVVVRNVVEEVEREMLSNFGDHRRSPELVAGRRRRENVFGGEKCFIYMEQDVRRLERKRPPIDIRLRSNL